MDVSETRTGSSKNRDEVGIRCQKLFQDFLEKFVEDGEVKYLGPCQELEKMERNCLEVSFDNVEDFNQELSTVIVEEYYRVYPYLCQALANVVKDYTESDGKKEFFVSFVDVVTREKLRELRSTKIGTLIRIKAQVIRTHPVHPELISGTFTCLDCNTVIHHVEQEFKFTQPTICCNPVCNNRRRFNLEKEKSTFIDFQKIKVQEVQSEQLPGSIPRSYDVILRAENVETVQSGSQYDFTGTLIAVPDVGVLSYPGAKAEMKARSKGGTGENVTEGVRGLKALGVRHLNHRLAFLACSAVPANVQFYSGDFRGEHLSVEEMRKNMTDAEWNKVYDMSKDRKIYENLINSLFPDIYGNEQVKKGVLLMLFGGVTKKTMEGTALRGDINCCIVGDPSTAKSLLLSQIAEFWPRCIYTSGKASSAAGLTAAVVRDEESNDFVIEPGAVLLADNGVCCIDEFDKMDIRDQVAIHEAMEQQTISIAKAGVRATLNARTSILAAANPVGGRYDRTKSLQQNVSLTAPIMSRFDLFFVMIDECNEVVDYAIAEKILAVHMSKTDSSSLMYTKEEALRYITFAKQFKPLLTKEAKELLINYYSQLRERDSQISNKYASRITVRQLESMVRLSEAMAKMECSDEVLTRHVSEAYNLLNKSIIRVEQPDIVLDEDINEPAIVNDEVAVHDDDRVENERAESSPQELPKKKLTLTYDEYVNLTNALVVFIRTEEERQMAAEERRLAEDGERGVFEGVRKSDVVRDYLERIGEELESEEELLEKKGLIERVIDRLLYQDQVLIPLTASSRPAGEDGTTQEEDDDPLIVVHPNYVLDV